MSGRSDRHRIEPAAGSHLALRRLDPVERS